jgi:DICT domain-containing protein/signal transduction histidine kinase
MSISNSVVAELLQSFADRRPQMYFKASLTALSHAMEDRVLAGSDEPLVIASFQKERFYRQEAHRYRRIAQKTDRVFVLAAPETDFKNSSDVYETVAFEATDALAQEWHLVILGQHYASCLICRERIAIGAEQNSSAMDTNRRFEGIWTFDRQVTQKAAELLLQRILTYRPELEAKIEQTCQLFLAPTCKNELKSPFNDSFEDNPDPFVQRLVTYLQAGHYKLIKANRFLAIKEQKERLINSVTTAIRLSLNTEEILQIAVQKLGEGLGVCRCIIYRCYETDDRAIINHEFLSPGVASIQGQTWLLKDNPFFQQVLTAREALKIDNTAKDSCYNNSTITKNQSKYLQELSEKYSIVSWLFVPVIYQGKLLGMVELHHCNSIPLAWKDDDVALVNAIATQVGVALIQAEAYANLEDLNEQLEALDRTRSNLVAITGHELRTPLSTIRVCLESLATEPDMSPELRQVMLNTAIADAERMRTLVQDFLTLSQLESGRIQWHPEPLSLQECIELAISHVNARNLGNNQPNIIAPDSLELPLVQADGEWLVEVLSKLLDNACKFTNIEGRVIIDAKSNDSDSVEVTISDTGRGIEPSRLERVFDRFYQEEGALRRSAGGTGLGLAICRQIVINWGGKIWAESAGKDQGSQFHFTVPIFRTPAENNQKSSLSNLNSKPKKTRTKGQGEKKGKGSR